MVLTIDAIDDNYETYYICSVFVENLPIDVEIVAAG